MALFADVASCLYSETCCNVCVVISGDGNCLLNAVSIFLSTTGDLALRLRQLIYRNLTVSPAKDEFRRRWKFERERQHKKIPNGGLEYTEKVSSYLPTSSFSIFILFKQ